MRNQAQIKNRQAIRDVANRLLAWLRNNNLAAGTKAMENIIKPFSEERNYTIYDVWQAWDLLREAKRRKPRPGIVWEIISYEPIEFDEAGKVRLTV